MLALGVILFVLVFILLLYMVVRDFKPRRTTSIEIDAEGLISAMSPEQRKAVEERLAFYRRENDANQQRNA